MAATLSSLSRPAPAIPLFRSSVIVFLGNSAARLLGFAFSIAAARLLLPSEYGLLAFSLSVAAIAATLLTTAPRGLARFLSRYRDDQGTQDAYFSNWLVVVGLTLGGSGLLLIPISALAGLSGWMILGIAANLIGVAVFEAYREIQRGLGHFATTGTYYILANALQLGAILAAAALGFRSAALFLVVYGLSSIAALGPMQLVAPIDLRFARQTLAWDRVRVISRFVRPLLFTAVFYAIWFGADLILVQRFLGPAMGGNYAVAKVLAGVLALAPIAIQTVVTPSVARLTEPEVRRYVVRVLALACSVTIPVTAALLLLARPLIAVVYGSKYPGAIGPLGILVLGFALHAVYRVLESFWIGLGRPRISAAASAVAMICTVTIALVLVPRMGMVGAAIAFAAGSASQLAVMATYTAWTIRPWRALP